MSATVDANSVALALVREIVEEYDAKANPNIPTYVLVEALKGKS